VHTANGRPLLVLLHGRGSNPDDVVGYDLLPALELEGTRAPNVLLIDGDDSSYYHDRAGGRWGSYVLSEAIPDAIRRLHADGRRIAIGGVSMGGFGALDLARLDPNRFCAVGGHSPALFETAADTPPGAFDDEADFRRHDLFAAAFARRPYRVPVWLDVGQGDPFRNAVDDFARLLRSRGVDVTMHIWPGSHEPAYWAAHMQAYLDFYVDALRSCP
jgi:S-formylglutathione hydrolase FrmB